MNGIECPYCGKDQGDPDEHTQEEYVEMKCFDCGKNFVYYASYSVHYHSEQAPCLNGGGHQWEKMCGLPKEYFKDMYRCNFCKTEKKIVDKEV